MTYTPTAEQLPCLTLIAEAYVEMTKRQKGFLQIVLQEDADQFRWLFPSMMIWCLQIELHSIQGDGSNLDFPCPLKVSLEEGTINEIPFDLSPENVVYLYHKDAAMNPNLCLKIPLIAGFGTESVKRVLSSINRAMNLPTKKENQN